MEKELKLENQLCFPLYIASKEVIKKYRPLLEVLDLTYTQYITMMVLWEKKELNVKTLGNILLLDSGTLTPLLRKLETKGYINRIRNEEDERNLIITITDKGQELKKNVKGIPTEVSKCINLTNDEAYTLYSLLYKVITGLEE
jgi:DNA-binding MarR family transcriptional regulator